MKKTFYFLLCLAGLSACSKNSDNLVTPVAPVKSKLVTITYSFTAAKRSTYDIGYVDSIENTPSLTINAISWSRTFKTDTSFNKVFAVSVQSDVNDPGATGMLKLSVTV
jgi:hypothetical protein